MGLHSGIFIKNQDGSADVSRFVALIRCRSIQGLFSLGHFKQLFNKRIGSRLKHICELVCRYEAIGSIAVIGNSNNNLDQL